MRKLMQAVVAAGGLIGLFAPAAIASTVTTTITLDFESLPSYSYIFSANNQYYQNHPLSEAGVTITSSVNSPDNSAPRGRIDDTVIRDNLGLGKHDLAFSTDLTFTGFPNSTTKIVAFKFFYKNVVTVTASGTNKDFSCGDQSCWKQTENLFLGVFDAATNEYSGVDTITLSGVASLGVVDNVSLTLRYESNDNQTPEPGSLGLTVAALSCAGFLCRRRRI